MSEAPDPLRLAELLAARLCHELVSPVGAIANGVEILDEEPDFARDAGRLIAQSARDARRRLQFYRVAYGSIGEVTTELARSVAAELFADGKVGCNWPDGEPALPGGWQKLVCNLLVVAAECLPRGGEIRVEMAGATFAVVAAGPEARLPHPTEELLAGAADPALLTPRTAQAAFVAALARRLGVVVKPRLEGDGQVAFTVHR
ncbi:MAG TPA: histidine phosphotransferase family protein [Stellaceae bacterium]|nr:histidine phosphotransferase family protein [Stellaceae bacterium]